MLKKITTRIDDIDIAKGLAIALVVWGHVVAGEPPKDNAWYSISKDYVYLFHMPFFMFLSGVVAGYGYRDIDNFSGWKSFVTGKITRLLPAYLLISITIVIGKLLAAKFVHVDNAPQSLIGGIVDVLVQPNKSNAKSFWFLYVLFLFYFSLHPLMLIFKRQAYALIVLGVVLQFVNGPEILLLDKYCQFFLFFAIGLNVGRDYENMRDQVRKVGMLSVFAFILSGVIFVIYPMSFGRSIVGFFSIPALMYAIGNIQNALIKKWLGFFGAFSFVIYLFNTIFIGISKAAGLKMVSWDGGVFLLFAPSLFLSGLFLPIILKKYVFAHVQVLDKITR